MAGVCAGCGLTTEGGFLAVAGARSVEWPTGAGVDLADRNGLRCDPETGNLWTPPDQTITQVNATGVGQTRVPTSTATVTLNDLTVTYAAGDLRASHVQVVVAGGTAQYRMANGNYWLVARSFTFLIDGVPTATTGLQSVSGHENNSGAGTTTASMVADAAVYDFQVAIGEEFEFQAHYEFQLFALVTNVVNAFVWRPPDVRLTAWTKAMPPA